MSDALEDHLVELVRAGDPAAAPMMVSYLADRLLGYAHGLAPELYDGDREKIVEYAVESGLRAFGQFDPDRGSLFAWFRRYVAYRTADWRRSTPPVVEVSEDQASSPGPAIDEEQASELRAHLRDALVQLPPDDRVMLALRASERLEFSEIGLRLDITAATARKRYQRARERLVPIIGADPVLARHIHLDPAKGATT